MFYFCLCLVSIHKNKFIHVSKNAHMALTPPPLSVTFFTFWCIRTILGIYTNLNAFNNSTTFVFHTEWVSHWNFLMRKLIQYKWQRCNTVHIVYNHHLQCIVVRFIREVIPSFAIENYKRKPRVEKDRRKK